MENFQTKLDLVWNLFPPQIRHKKFPNQTGFGLEICDNIFSFQTKLGLVWKIVTTFLESVFQTKLDLVWTLFTPQIRHEKFPNQTGFGLEKCDNIFRIAFPNQIGFGLETDTV